jgi:hypothetical protein
LVPALFATPCCPAPAAEIELELVTQQGFPLTGSRQWIEVFKNQDVQLRIRSATPGDRVEIVNRGTESAPVYHVRGLLTRQNTLMVPGGRFTPRDRAQIAAWIDKLRRGGLDPSGGSRPSAFGLTGEELVSLHESLATRVSESTKGEDPKDVIRRIASRIRTRVVVGPAARGAFVEGDTVYDELQGVSCGTALAAVVRPAGLVVVPSKVGSEIQLSVVDSRRTSESWPIGWPPEKKERELVPKLYEFLPVEIEGAQLTEALEAVRGRLGVPMLFDQNSMARHRVDPAKVRVSLPVGRTYYKKALDRMLFQGQLKAEVRVDEASQPLLWVSTIKK